MIKIKVVWFLIHDKKQQLKSKMLIMLPLQGVFSYCVTYPGRCPGLFYSRLSACNPERV